MSDIFDNLSDEERAEMIQELDNRVEAFPDSRLILAWERAQRNAEDDDMESLAERFGFELSAMAWGDILDELKDKGKVEVKINEQGERIFYPADLDNS